MVNIFNLFNPFRSWRISTAFKFASLEHKASRFLFVMLLITYGVYYLKRYDILNYFLLADIGLWIVYFLAHNFEKMFFPSRIR